MHPGSFVGSWQCDLQVLLCVRQDGPMPGKGMGRMLIPPLGSFLLSGFSR